MNASNERMSRRGCGWIGMLGLTVAGMIINFAGVRVALALKLPLFLDCIGTLLAAALGGYIPGVAVGFLTNIVNGLSDYTTAYYGVLNVLIALYAAYAAKKNWFGRLSRTLMSVLVLAAIGGGLGSVLTWFLYGGGFGEGISLTLAKRIHGNVQSVFLSQLAADVLIDLLDKAVCVALVAVVIALIPAGARERMHFYGWRQAPLTGSERSRADRRKLRALSLRAKVMLLIGTATIVIAVVVTTISFKQFHEANIEQQTRLAMGVANVVAGNFDPEQVNGFLEKGEAAEGYNEIKARLSGIMNSTRDIQFVYVYRIMQDGCHVVFDPDTPEVKGEAPGTVIPFDEAFMQYVPDLLAGRSIPPIISDETYGWLLTVYLPVYNTDGICVCYAAADISMSEIAAEERIFLARVIALFAGFFVLILALGAWLAEYNIILPINTMAMAADAFAYNSEAARADSLEHIRRLDIRTGDEIENLYRAMSKTTEDTARYIAEAQEKNETISRLQNGMIMVMADLVESRDKCTGDHVRKTAAYAGIIMRQMQREGIYAEALTEEYIQDVVNSAPLHDVGKIKISDTLLNKPGRLTDDEFHQMQNHTLAGGEIIDQAIGSVSSDESGYLNEARNLANYHHEKWDGSGYPRGLKGEEIPLSARIMAVADVFDALVSKRSYKPGFSVDRAMEIIREGMGTHFDPQVAQAFLDAGDEVRRVAEEYRSAEE